ncbi:hypothetical protein MVEN_02287700 [Mycena venus]|uniref:DUF6535 domain-containing protein n=1 Tax=Mycena venus TaxID=2733690 RepID=A0A8H6X4Z4_9AGAR|nr:hypothetical protein MVEN_02287700 [Mycena venus]
MTSYLSDYSSSRFADSNRGLLQVPDNMPASVRTGTPVDTRPSTPRPSTPGLPYAPNSSAAEDQREGAKATLQQVGKHNFGLHVLVRPIMAVCRRPLKWFFHLKAKPEQSDVRKGESINDDSPFKRHCSDNSDVWRLYLAMARTFNETMAASLNNNLDPLLIFAGLFSAILTAFLVETRKKLHEDPRDIANDFLKSLVLDQHDIPDSASFEPTLWSLSVNGAWFTSLFFSLSGALCASIAKGWMAQFSSFGASSGWSNAAHHSRFLRGVERWQLSLAIQCLPLLIHFAYILFSVGFIVLVFHDERTVGLIILMILLVSVVIVWVGPIFLSQIFPDYPYRTPLTELITGLSPFLRDHRRAFRPFPSSEDAQKAFALSWLLRQFLDDETRDAAIRAVAGLPFTVGVQDELIHGSTAGVIVNRLSTELLKLAPDPEFLRACLFALLHVVQTVPWDTREDKLGLCALINEGGALFAIDSMPAGAQEVALCLKGRIKLFSLDPIPDTDTDFFQTDIPALARSCDDGCLRRFLLELCLLFDGQSQYLKTLREQHASRRLVHAQLTEGAIREQEKTLARMRPKLNLPPPSLKVAHFLCEEAVAHAVVREILFSSQMMKTMLEGQAEEDATELIDAYVELLVAKCDGVNTRASAEGVLYSLLAYGLRHQTSQERILTSIRDLSKYDGFRRAIATPTIITRIIPFLDDESCAVRYAALKVFEQFSPSDATIIPELLPTFIEKLDDVDEDVQETALQLICTLCNSTTSHEANSDATKAVHAIVIPKLNEQISLKSEIKAGVLRLLAILSQDDSTGTIISISETIEKVLPLLEHSSLGIREAAVRTLRALLQRGAMTSYITAKLVAGLAAGNFFCSSVSETLENLSQRDDFRSAITTPEVQDEINRVLTSDPPWCFHLALFKTLSGLSKHDAVGARIATPTILAQLFPGLSHWDEDVRAATIDLIVALGEHSNLRAKVFDANVLEKLLSMLGDPYDCVRQSAFRALSAFYKHGDFGSAIAAGIRATIDTFLTGESLKLQLCLRFLHDISKKQAVNAAIETFETFSKIVGLWDGDEIVDRFTRDDAESFLRRLDKNTDEAVHRILFDGIKSYAESDTVGAAIAVCEMFASILPRLNHKDADIRQVAAKAIAALADHDLIGLLITSQVGDKILLQVQNADADEYTKQLALDSIVSLAQYEIVCSALGTAAMVLKLQCNENTAIRSHSQDVFCPTIVTADVIAKISQALEDREQYVRATAILANTTLSMLGVIGKTILSANVMKYIDLERKQGMDSETAKDVISFLSKFDKGDKVISSEKIKATLRVHDEDANVRQEALDAIVSLSNLNMLSADSITPSSREKIICLCKDPDEDVQNAAVGAALKLLKGDNAVLPIIDIIIDMLGEFKTR